MTITSKWRLEVEDERGREGRRDGGTEGRMEGDEKMESSMKLD